MWYYEFAGIFYILENRSQAYSSLPRQDKRHYTGGGIGGLYFRSAKVHRFEVLCTD